MPYQIKQIGDQWCVLKEDQSEPGDGMCHSTEPEAKDHMAALHANVEDAKGLGDLLQALGLIAPDADEPITGEALQDALRTLMFEDANLDLVADGGALKALGDGMVEGCAVMWSDPAKKDLTGEFFDAETALFWDGKEPRPGMYHHGLDTTLGNRLVGEGWAKARTDDVGLWVKMQLNMRDQYERAIYKLAEAGKLGLSSGTAKHMIVREDDGYLKRWPIAEISFTPAPAEPRTLVRPLKSTEMVDVPSFKALIVDMSLAESIGASNGSEPAPPEDVSQAEPAVKSTKESMQHQEESGGQEMKLLKQILDVIEAQVELDEEQAAQVSSAIEKMIASGAFAGKKEKKDDEYSDGDGSGQKKAMDPEAFKAGVMAVLEEAGLTADGEPTGRPPYAFKGVDPDGNDEEDEDMGGDPIKAIATLQLGDMDRATKAVATDLYGPDYAVKRYQQHQAYGQYLRAGERGLSMEQVKALKMIILTPRQIKSMVRSGSFASVAEVKTDLSNVVGQLGAYMVPEDFRMEMIERLPGMTVVRPRADVMRTTSDMMSRIKVTGGDSRSPTGMGVTWVGDVPAEDDADTNPTFGVEKTPIHIAKCTVPVPMALLEDSGVPLADKITGWASQEFALDEDEQFLVGNGIAKPQGILPGGSNTLSITEKVTGHASTIDDADVILTVRRALHRQYRNDAAWIMNEATAGIVDKLKDGNGRYLWEPSLKAGEPDRLAGYPVLTDEAMPDVAANAYPIIFGNLRGYQIADRVGMSVRRDDLTQAEEDIVKFLFRRRLGGQVARDWAFVVVKVAAS